MKLILGVEDEKPNIRALDKALRKEGAAGYKIVRTYLEAQRELERGLYDGVLLDMMFPKGGTMDDEEGLRLFRSVINVIGDEPTRDYYNSVGIMNLESVRLPGIHRDYKNSGSDHQTKYDQLLGCIKDGERTGVLPFGVYVMEMLAAMDIPGVVVSSARHFVDPLFSFIGGQRQNGRRIRMMSSDDFGSKSDTRIWEAALVALRKEMEEGGRKSA